MSKINILFLGGVLILISLLGLFFWVQKTSAEIGNIQVFTGNAKLIRNSEATDARTGQVVKVKDEVRVSGGSKVSIVLKDSSVIRLDENTEVEVGQLTYKGQKIKDATFKLIAGRLWSRVSPLDGDGQFEVETPTVVATVRGTSFNTTYSPQVSGVYVYKRLVSVTLQKDRSKTQNITKDMLLRMQNDKLEEDFAAGPKTVDPSYIDEWIKFNQSEDDKICRNNPKTPGCDDYFEPSLSPSPSPSLTPLPTTYKSPSPRPTTKLTPTQTPTPTKTPTPTPIPQKKLLKLEVTHDPFIKSYSIVAIAPETSQFYAKVYFSDGTTLDVTKEAKWLIEAPANGKISSGGLYTAGQVKKDTVIATYEGISSSHIIDSNE